MGKLTATAIKNAKPKEKKYNMSDGGGMFLMIKPNGSRWWRFSYRFDGKQKQLSLGTYPDTTLANARKQCREARELLAEGFDPSIERQNAKAMRKELLANSFEAVARDWLKRKEGDWSQTNIHKVTRQLEVNIFPWIGKHPISEIKAPVLLSVLRRMEDRGVLETARRLRATCSKIYRYAITVGYAEHDIDAYLCDAMPTPSKQHLAALTEPKEVAALMRAIDSFDGSHIVSCALRLSPLVFLRPGELRIVMLT